MNKKNKNSINSPITIEYLAHPMLTTVTIVHRHPPPTQTHFLTLIHHHRHHPLSTQNHTP